MDKELEKKLKKSSKSGLSFLDKVLSFLPGNSYEKISFGEMSYEELQKIDISHLSRDPQADIESVIVEKSTTSEKFNFLK